jgi:hypothetical protein
MFTARIKHLQTDNEASQRKAVAEMDKDYSVLALRNYLCSI